MIDKYIYPLKLAPRVSVTTTCFWVIHIQRGRAITPTHSGCTRRFSLHSHSKPALPIFRRRLSCEMKTAVVFHWQENPIKFRVLYHFYIDVLYTTLWAFNSFVPWRTIYLNLNEFQPDSWELNLQFFFFLNSSMADVFSWHLTGIPRRKKTTY